jgi:hypothetical protein
VVPHGAVPGAEHHKFRRTPSAPRAGPMLAGRRDATVRTKLMSNGAAVVTWSVKATPVLGGESADVADADG